MKPKQPGSSGFSVGHGETKLLEASAPVSKHAVLVKEKNRT